MVGVDTFEGVGEGRRHLKRTLVIPSNSLVLIGSKLVGKIMTQNTTPRFFLPEIHVRDRKRYDDALVVVALVGRGDEE